MHKMDTFCPECGSLLGVATTESDIRTSVKCENCGERLPLGDARVNLEDVPTDHTRVWVMLYEHRHGSDISIYASEKAADRAGADIARQWWVEACEIATVEGTELPARPPADDRQAISDYFEVMGDLDSGSEHLTIEEQPIQGGSS